MAPRIPQLPATPPHAMTDHACEICGHLMCLRRSRDEHWFYGCTRWPVCCFTFDADQATGAPIVHTRHGIPFRTPRKVKGAGLFEALKRNGFDPAAGRLLEQAQKKARAKRQQALKDMGREEVKARLKAASPKTPEEWLEFVLAERVIAVQDYRNEEKLKAQVAPKAAARRNPQPEPASVWEREASGRWASRRNMPSLEDVLDDI